MLKCHIAWPKIPVPPFKNSLLTSCPQILFVQSHCQCLHMVWTAMTGRQGWLPWKCSNCFSKRHRSIACCITTAYIPNVSFFKTCHQATILYQCHQPKFSVMLTGIATSILMFYVIENCRAVSEIVSQINKTPITQKKIHATTSEWKFMDLVRRKKHQRVPFWRHWSRYFCNVCNSHSACSVRITANILKMYIVGRFR